MTTIEVGPSPSIASRRSPFSIDPRLRRVAPFVGYLAVQLFVVAGLTTLAYPDSATYVPLSFDGNAPQLPTVPLLYHVFPNDGWRLFGQALLAAICWWSLASAVARLVRDRRVRLGARLVILALGLVGPISSWNTTILSESTAISLTVAMLAAWLTYATRPSWIRAAVGLIVTIAWTYVRQAHAALAVLIVLVALAAVLGRRRDLQKLVIALVLLASTAYALTIVDRNKYVSNGVIADIVQDRILVNRAYTLWFVNAGMPYSPAIQATAGGPYGDALQSIPEMETWLTEHGDATYASFLLHHLNYTLYDPLPYFSGERTSLHEEPSDVYPGTDPNPTPSILSPTADYGRYREVIPAELTNLLFEQGQIGDVLVLAVGTALVYLASRRRYGRDRRLVVPGLFLLSVIPQGYLVWIEGGVGELDRLSIVTAVTARISLWTIAALCADRLVAAPSAAAPGPLEGSSTLA